MLNFWNSPASLSLIGTVSIYVALAAALTGALVGAAGTVASNRANDILTRQTNVRIAKADARAAEANARAEAARARAAEANERIEKMQQVRRLTVSQIDSLETLFRSEVFANKDTSRLRFSSVQDVEARMFAYQLQECAGRCGVDIFPTEGGWPGTVLQINPADEDLILHVKSYRTFLGIKHLVAFMNVMADIGLPLAVAEDPELEDQQGLLIVLKKRAA